MYTYDENGYVEEGQVFIQLKATDAITTHGENVVFAADIRDYNLWIREPMPVFLVVYDAAEKRACWLYVQEYFELDSAFGPEPGRSPCGSIFCWRTK